MTPSRKRKAFQASVILKVDFLIAVCKHCNTYKCFPTAQREILLYADYSYNKIVRVSPHDSGSRDRLLFSNTYRPCALDYDQVEDRLYWTDGPYKNMGKISRAFLNGSSQETIIYENVYTTYGLAVDSVGRNLYWTNAGKSMLEVSKLDGSRRISLMTHNIDQPMDIILDIYRRLVVVNRWISIQVK